ncbi:MAG: hypothetical protein ACJ8AT_33390 [Hyalangium sp.]|uniref:hypothetical protein n=1 Tax=Hyalangium sp. TaxID=2028555 RepID=UPI00389AD642
MRRMQSVGVSAVLAATLLLGCGGEEKPPPVSEPQVSPQCDSPTEYLAFDPANSAPQELRLQRIDDILALFDAATANVAVAGDKAAQALALYQGSEARLRADVQGRMDLRSSPALLVGPELDATLTGAIEDLRKATTAYQARVARQRLVTSGFSRFLYLSVMEELLTAPSREHYDQAYGYLGTGRTNAEAGRRSFARMATERDATNETALAPDLFALVISGACTLDGALEYLGKDSMEVEEDEPYARLTRMMDARLQLILVYSLSHELFAYTRVPTDAQAAQLALIGADGLLRTLEPSLQQSGQERIALAHDLREALDAALAASRPDDPAWIPAFKAQEFLDRIQASWFIDVKG